MVELSGAEGDGGWLVGVILVDGDMDMVEAEVDEADVGCGVDEAKTGDGVVEGDVGSGVDEATVGNAAADEL